MITSGNARGIDANGKPVLWSSQRQQVMMHWEKKYMQACVNALHIRPTDRVLEIGFGLAYSATHIQRNQPQRHAIVECDAAVIRDAEQFANEHSGVEILRGTWQTVLSTLREQFDCVFFDDYPLPELERAGVTHNQTRSLRSRSRWHDFLDAVLPLVAVGGRITGYLARDIDLQRCGCRVAITQLRVATSADCAYFPHETALVPVITVLDATAAAAGISTTATTGTDEDSSTDTDSDAALRVPLFPSCVSAAVLERVSSLYESRSAERPASVQSNDAVVSHASTSQRRRFAAIRACLNEQTLLMDFASPSSESGSTVDADAEADDDDNVESSTLATATRYHDTASRTQFLAALRAKRASACVQTPSTM